MNFPELPEPSYWRSPRPVGGGVLYRSRLDAVRNYEQLCDPVFTAEQLLAYGSAIKEWAAKEERERIARFIDEGYVRQWQRPWREDLVAAIREGKQ